MRHRSRTSLHLAHGVAHFPQNRRHVLIGSMDLSTDLTQFAEADRRDVDPPIQVEMTTWSNASQLDWWVRERREWWGRVRGANGRQRWIKAADLRPANGLQGEVV